MIEKEISELRRRMRPDKNALTAVHGCYVTGEKKIISRFSQSIGLMTEDENEKYMTLLRKALSGGCGRNLIDIPFRTQQVADSDEHRLLMSLRAGLDDEQLLGQLFEKIIESVVMEGNYLILIVRDVYDVPTRTKDNIELADGSSEVFSYLLCSICPVSPAKPALCYAPSDCVFHDRAQDWIVCAPEAGFLFPAFDDRRSNIYNALFYTRDPSEGHEALISALFNIDPPKPAGEQKSSFETILGETLEDECSLDLVETVHDSLCGLIAQHKSSKEPEPLTVSARQISGMLESCGVSSERLERFSERCDEEFGADAQLRPRNLIDTTRIGVKTPDVVIKVNPERSDLIETRIINGSRYILIRADDGVEVNGVNIHIPADS